jgi:hypothetical protein
MNHKSLSQLKPDYKRSITNIMSLTNSLQYMSKLRVRNSFLNLKGKNKALLLKIKIPRIGGTDLETPPLKIFTRTSIC